MHIIETMSACTGLKIHRPYIETEEVELPYKEYITFHPAHKKGTRRKYNKWIEVIKNLNLNIIQVGGLDENDYSKFGVDTRYADGTTLNQLAYIIKNAKMHLGYDSLPVHLASYFDVPVVAIYNQWSSHSYPYFSKNNIIIEPDYDAMKIKPCFNHNDPFDLINTIDAKLINEAVSNLMKECKICLE